jgi:hypothetical protein
LLCQRKCKVTPREKQGLETSKLYHNKTKKDEVEDTEHEILWKTGTTDKKWLRMYVSWLLLSWIPQNCAIL